MRRYVFALFISLLPLVSQADVTSEHYKIIDPTISPVSRAGTDLTMAGSDQLAAAAAADSPMSIWVWVGVLVLGGVLGFWWVRRGGKK